MRIESMTATFGKLHSETLTLSPGLNVLELPNETGKSTWCAFLLAMLYGIDTSERETKTNFPAKKHYAPWSGTAMEGQMVLEHEGRRITIERSSTARAPLGVFRAYDTDSGLPIETLTAQNCGQMLLGVPRQVFERSAFLRQDGMAIQMEATLEQRLGALVTTGDETISYQKVEQQLRERRNHCRHNKTGLIPQTEATLAAVEERLARLDKLHETMAQARLDEQRLSGQRNTLRLQCTSLQAQQAEERRLQLAQVGAEATEKKKKAEQLTLDCALLPPISTLEAWEQTLGELQAQQHTLALDYASLPPQPAAPAMPAPIQGLSDAEIAQKANVDAAQMRLLQAKKKPSILLWAVLSAISFLACGALAIAKHPALAVAAAVIAVILAIVGVAVLTKKLRLWNRTQEVLQQYYMAYGVKTPDGLIARCDRCRAEYAAWQLACEAREKQAAALKARKEKADAACSAMLETVADGLKTQLTLADAPAKVRQAITQQMECEATRRSAEQTYRHYCSLKEAFEAMPKPTPPFVPVPEGKTLQGLQAELYAAEAALQAARSTLDRSRGQCSTLGDPTELEAKKQQLSARLEALNLEYDALSVALTAIGKANETLQNRFAPQLTSLASDYLSQLTDGAYSQLMLDRNLSASLYPAEAPASREAAYFSGGTKDQLYFAVRLAVSRLLVPLSPLILDDALVRFDDLRLWKALTVLQKEAKQRQVLLFTCQSRENAALKAANRK